MLVSHSHNLSVYVFVDCNLSNRQYKLYYILVLLVLVLIMQAEQVKFLIIAIAYFTKWFETDPVTAITSDLVKKFYWRIVCRFGIPQSIVSDNNTQFASKTVAQFCQGLNIQ